MKATLHAATLAAGLILAIAGSGHAQEAAPGRQVASQAVTSFALIDRALEARAIDAETAHRYRVFAAFADTRLPATYRGDDRGMFALPPSVAEVGRLLETFSPATRAELAPFFMRPDEPGSWITLRTIPGQEPAEARGFDRGGPGPAGSGLVDSDPSGPFDPTAGFAHPSSGPAAASQPARIVWQSFPAVGGKAKVWWQDRYPGDSAIAQGLASQLTSLIWGKLTVLMRQEPYPDNGIVSNGGDAAFDFYLVHAPADSGWIGAAPSSIAAVPCHPARYIQIDTRTHGLGSARTYGVLQIATHELMHAIAAAYRVRNGCPSSWINEASAEWASNWVYPLTDEEHKTAKEYLNTVNRPLDTFISKSQRDYGEHLLPYYLEMTGGGPGFMPRMWTNFKTMDVLEGVNAVLPGGFEKSWPLFLVQLWNRPPVDAPHGYRQWDRLDDGVVPWGGLTDVRITSGVTTLKMEFLPANPTAYIFEGGVQPLSGHFRHFRFDDSVRSLVFRNTIREEGLLYGTVWGIEKIDGTWQKPADWTEALQKAWCRDVATENIEELVIVFGNHDWKTKTVVSPREEPTLEASPLGCSGWTGTSTLVNTLVSDDPAITIVETVNTTIRFAVDSTLIIPGEPRQYWKSVGGTIRWRVQVTGTCTGSAQGGVTIPNLRDDHVASLSIWSEGGRLHHSGWNGPWPGDIPQYAITCPTGPSQMLLIGALGFFATDSDRDDVAADGKSFSGRFTNRPSPANTVSHSYSFRCASGC